MTAIRGEAAGVPFAALPPDEPAVERYERLWDVRYRWSGRSLAVADRLDFVARADQIPARDDGE